MAGVDAVWHFLAFLWDWLFVDECSTATSLLSLSFSVNSVFAGLSLSRFDLCGGLRKKAVKCIDGIADDKIVGRIELLRKVTPSLDRKLLEFVKKADKCKTALQTEASVWEKSRLWITVCCAVAAFLMIAFEINTRIGFVLVLPYFLVLLFHFACVRRHVRQVKKGYDELLGAMSDAEQEVQNPFNSSDCISRLKADIAAISSSADTVSNNGSRKFSKT